mmetsp:Transcript_32865/g.96940  ORF Transcript_32865/g.96940 Transcript_32865/m.96940 type:complete len:209 (-) Transcript_32865:1351-1977(-)
MSFFFFFRRRAIASSAFLLSFSIFSAFRLASAAAASASAAALAASSSARLNSSSSTFSLSSSSSVAASQPSGTNSDASALDESTIPMTAPLSRSTSANASTSASNMLRPFPKRRHGKLWSFPIALVPAIITSRPSSGSTGGGSEDTPGPRASTSFPPPSSRPIDSILDSIASDRRMSARHNVVGSPEPPGSATDVIIPALILPADPST